MNRYILLVVMALSMVSCAAPQEARITTAEAIKVGSRVPIFHAKDVEGRKFDMSEAVGRRKYAILFWSIFCQPCRDVMPIVEKTANRCVGTDIEVITVNMDGEPFLDAVRGYLRGGNYSFRVLLDESHDNRFDVADSFQVLGAPALYLVDKQGIITSIRLGKFTEREFAGLIDKLRGMP